MRAITIETTKVYDNGICGEKPLRCQWRQDNGSRWSIWTESWIERNFVRISSGHHVDEVLEAVNRFRKDPDQYIIKFELI